MFKPAIPGTVTPKRPPKLWRVAVTFEAPDTASPETIRLESVDNNPATVAAHAVRDAKKLRTGRNLWESVLILLEKVPR